MQRDEGRARAGRAEPTNLRRGKGFEAREKAAWTLTPGELLAFEKRIRDPKGKWGRLDVFVQSDPELVGIGEIKATDWDKISMDRVRALALRHARQTWRYIDAHLLEGLDASPGIIYPKAPRSARKKVLVEETVNERMIQCVWREDRGSPVPRVADRRSG